MASNQYDDADYYIPQDDQTQNGQTQNPSAQSNQAYDNNPFANYAPTAGEQQADAFQQQNTDSAQNNNQNLDHKFDVDFFDPYAPSATTALAANDNNVGVQQNNNETLESGVENFAFQDQNQMNPDLINQNYDQSYNQQASGQDKSQYNDFTDYHQNNSAPIPIKNFDQDSVVTEDYEPDGEELFGDSPIKAPPYPYTTAEGGGRGKKNKDGLAAHMVGDKLQTNFDHMDHVELYKTPEQQRMERYEKLEAMAYQYEQALRVCGHGKWQWYLFFILGLGLMADGVEIFIAGFVLPAAEKDLCISSNIDSSKGWMSKWAFIGMMLGGLIWGPASDTLGRRQALLCCLSLSAFFGVFSAFVTGFTSFIFCRFLSCFNIGGAIPIIFAFWSELLPREKRSEHISWMCLFWMVGGIYGSWIAYMLIPSHGWSFYMGSDYKYHSWRMFIVVCSMPSIAAAALLTIIPESPRWLLEVGQKNKALEVLATIHAKNKHGEIFDIDIECPDPVDEIIEITDSTKRFRNRIWIRTWTIVMDACKKYYSIILGPDQQIGKTTFKLWVIMLCLSTGYYGMGLWIPDQIKHVQINKQIYKNKTVVVDYDASSMSNFFGFNQTSKRIVDENIWAYTFNRCDFQNMTFKGINIHHTYFDRSHFRNCTFISTNMQDVFFESCDFTDVKFVKTHLAKNMFSKEQFQGMNGFRDSSTLKSVERAIEDTKQCYVNTDPGMHYDSAMWLYLIALLGTLSVIPGNVLTALFMGRIGRTTVINGSMVMAAATCLLLYFVQESESGLLTVLCLFNAISIAAWCAITVLVCEAYGTEKRTTGLAAVYTISKFSAILATIIYPSMTGVPLGASLVTCVVLCAGGVYSTHLRDTHNEPLY